MNTEHISPIVQILVTIPKPEYFEACTLCFDSIRTGFPTARIEVTANAGLGTMLLSRLVDKIEAAGASWRPARGGRIHHAAWIKQSIEEHDSRNGPLVILDADTIFWKSCEDWAFPESTLLAGYYVPKMWNDFAGCVSLPRLHTSLLWIPNTTGLRNYLHDKYPKAHDTTGDYSPCDPYMPAVKYICGRPYFWDSCANLYGMLAGKEPLTYAFEPRHLECFDHLNSASFFDVMLDRLDGDKEGFAYLHRFAANPANRAKLRNLWPIVERYYKAKAYEADRQPIIVL